MACITPDDVKQIMVNCPLTEDQIEPFISSAETIVDNVFVNDTTTSTDVKNEIKKWLTAHMIASIYDRPAVEEKVGEAYLRYSDKPMGLGLDSTPYGQMVKQLDPTGLMATAGKRAASIYAVKSFK